MNLIDLDYFKTKDKIIYLVKGYYHPSQRVFAYPIYWPNQRGERTEPSTGQRYKKEIDELNNKKIFSLRPYYRHRYIPKNCPLIPKSEIIKVYKPKKKICDFIKREKKTIWYKIFNGFINIAKIPRNNIGIFGSYLVDLAQDNRGKMIKDIDFAIYGRNNCRKLKQKIGIIRKKIKLGKISPSHIAYQQQRYGSIFSQKNNSFNLSFKRKWSSLQIKEGLLSTVRFVYNKNEIPQNPIRGKTKGPIRINGLVVDDFKVNFLPRSFVIKNGNKYYKVITYFWSYHQTVKNGDFVTIFGDLFAGNTIVIDDSNHGIKIINNKKLWQNSLSTMKEHVSD